MYLSHVLNTYMGEEYLFKIKLLAFCVIFFIPIIMNNSFVGNKRLYQ